MAQYTSRLQSPKLKYTFPYGLNENTDPDIGECTAGFNFELGYSKSSLDPRPPFDLVGTAPNGSSVDGIMQLVTRSNVQTTVITAGTIAYKFDGTSWTNVGTITAGSKMRDVYWSLGDYLVITDVSLGNVVKKWDGTTFSNMTTGLGVPLYAKFGIVHLNRVWLFNVTTSTATPHLMVASTFEDPTSYNVSNRGGPTTLGGYSGFSTGTEPFFMVAPDLKPINGVALVGSPGTLVISTTGGRLFQLTGTNAKDFEWTDFYDGSSAVSDEAIANIGNDVTFMRQGGHISSLTVTQFAGNAKTAELSRFIPSTIANLSSCQIGYDKVRQKVYYFVTNKVLTLFKDLIETGKSPWSVYETNHSSNFTTNCVKYMQWPGTNTYNVFWGDSSGNLYAMDGTGGGDAGTTAIYTSRQSIKINKNIMDPWPYSQELISGEVKYRRNNAIDFTVQFDWDEEFSTTSSTLSLKGPPSNDTGLYWGGTNYWSQSIYWNQGFTFSKKPTNFGFSPTGKGPGFYMTCTATTTKNWKVDQVDLY